MAKTDVSVFFNSKELRKMVDEERMNIDVTIRSLERRIDDMDHIIELTTETLANRSAGMADLAERMDKLEASNGSPSKQVWDAVVRRLIRDLKRIQDTAESPFRYEDNGRRDMADEVIEWLQSRLNAPW